MMSILEYANDVKVSTTEIMKKCRELNIKFEDENSMLNDDSIVELDSALNYVNKQTEDASEEEILDEIAEKIVSTIDMDDTIKLEKLKKKSAINVEDFLNKKRNMYKNKEKLISNAPTKQDNIVIYKDGMTLNDLAQILQVNAIELIKKYISLGAMVTVNSPISFEDTELVVIDYEKELKKAETQDETNFEKLEIFDDKQSLEERPPVVTIMGHVDHGKTSLLDAIRKTNVVSGEVGGITQNIGAYQVECNNKKITFIDTPGHAAFTEMRARGASITDIVIIVVAADEGIKPQTLEAIDHAKAAKVPIIVAINKIDKKGADPEKIINEMAANGITSEKYGGKVPFVKVSALTGEGISDLLETILINAEVLELKANKNRYALGTVVEAKADKNFGPLVTLLIQNGTLRIGDPIVVGTTYGKVRTLKNDKKEDLVEALPSMPIEITGLNDMPTSGDKFMAFEDEKQARAIAETRKVKAKQKKEAAVVTLSMEDLFNKIQSGVKEINIVLKTDVKGSEEAVKNSLEKIEVLGVKINIIRSATGTITESDVILAHASNAIVIGFNVKPSPKTVEMAKDYGVDIRLYNIIYKAVEELELAMKGMLDPEYEEKIIGNLEVRKTFKFSKIGTIAGGIVSSGVIKQGSKARLIRDGVVVFDSVIGSIQREKDSVKEVKKGFECGVTLENYNDIKEQDIIETYEMIEIKK